MRSQHCKHKIKMDWFFHDRPHHFRDRSDHRKPILSCKDMYKCTQRQTLTQINNDDNNMLCHVIGEVNARTTTTITTMVKREMK
jgi:hypothetical protein